MKKKCKAYTQSKFFNDRIKDIENLLESNIPSREDIVLTRYRSSIHGEKLEEQLCEMN